MARNHSPCRVVACNAPHHEVPFGLQCREADTVGSPAMRACRCGPCLASRVHRIQCSLKISGHGKSTVEGIGVRRARMVAGWNVGALMPVKTRGGVPTRHLKYYRRITGADAEY